MRSSRSSELAVALLGDSVTTDHISPAGAIARPAGEYHRQRVPVSMFNSLFARQRGHDAGTRQHPYPKPSRTRTEGGYTTDFTDGRSSSSTTLR